ncbi:MAG: T9SS type A sorting domain-containing protein, partial [bacterium]
PVYDMEIASDGYIYLATPDKGIYRINPTLLDLPRDMDETNLSEFRLYPNYPNPFNSGTTLDFFIPKTSPVKIEIFDLVGQKVCTLWNGQREAGRHSLYWIGQDDKGKDVSSGVYVYRFESGGFTETKKILLIR